MMPRLLLAALMALGVTAAEGGQPPRVFGGGDVKEVLWVRLDKDADVLKSMMAIIAEHKIQDGAVLNAVGNLAACKFHGVNGTMTEITEPLEILNLAGMIADGKPHFHVIVSNKALGAVGGHLEEGCRVGAQIEVMLVRFKGPAMTRRAPKTGGPVALQPK
jgi:predicted DNA-binding protein with PD1-like motif